MYPKASMWFAYNDKTWSLLTHLQMDWTFDIYKCPLPVLTQDWTMNKWKCRFLTAKVNNSLHPARCLNDLCLAGGFGNGSWITFVNVFFPCGNSHCSDKISCKAILKRKKREAIGKGKRKKGRGKAETEEKRRQAGKEEGAREQEN